MLACVVGGLLILPLLMPHLATTGWGERSDVDEKFGSKVQASRWLQHVTFVINGALRVASLVNAGDPVLVHCR